MKLNLLIISLLFATCCSNYNSAKIISEKEPYEIIDVSKFWDAPKYRFREESIEIEKVIHLETNDISVLSNIREIEFSKNYIYILDRYQNGSVAIFSSDGHFVNRVKQGAGPEEISAGISIFFDDDNDCLLIYDCQGNKLSKYSPEGEYISNIYVQGGLTDFSVVDTDILYVQPTAISSNSTYVKLMDSIAAEKSVWDLGQDPMPCLLPKCLYKSDNGVAITQVFSNTAFLYQNNDISKYFTIIGPNTDFSNIQSLEDMNKKMSDDEYCFSGEMLESKDFRELKFDFPHWNQKTIFQSRKTGEIWQLQFDDNESVLSYIIIKGVYSYENNTFWGLIYPEDYVRLRSSDCGKQENNPLISPGDMEKLRNVKPDDNPIIVLFKLKDE